MLSPRLRTVRLLHEEPVGGLRTMVMAGPGSADGLFGPVEIRKLAAELQLRPTKSLGQNFLVDANTIRRIVRTASLRPSDVVLEVGPGLGSLTLGLLPACRRVVAVEVDPALAETLASTVDRRRAAFADRLEVLCADALRLEAVPGPQPTAMVANLPYNVAVPILLHLLEALPSLDRVLIMVQAEVADRLAAEPGSRTYGVPSAKTAWYVDVRRAGPVSRHVFWPVPNVDSGLVSMTRREPPAIAGREETFAVIDAAFAQRRKTLRAALSGWAGSAVRAEEILRAADVDPAARGESLDINAFARIAAARSYVG